MRGNFQRVGSPFLVALYCSVEYTSHLVPFAEELLTNNKRCGALLLLLNPTQVGTMSCMYRAGYPNHIEFSPAAVEVDSGVVDVVSLLSTTQTPHEIKQLSSMYEGLSSHCPVLAHRGQSLFASAHARVVVVVVDVVVVAGLIVAVVSVDVVVLLVVVVVIFKVGPAQTPHDIKQLFIMYSGFNSHCPVRAHTGQPSSTSTHGLVVVVVVTVVVVGMAMVLLVVVDAVVVSAVVGVIVAVVFSSVVEVDVVELIVGPAQTPHEIRQLDNMYDGLRSHWLVSAQYAQSSLTSTQGLVVVVVVPVVMMGGKVVVLVVVGFAVVLVVVDEVVLGVGPAHTPHEIKQFSNMYPGFNSH